MDEYDGSYDQIEKITLITTWKQTGGCKNRDYYSCPGTR